MTYDYFSLNELRLLLLGTRVSAETGVELGTEVATESDAPLRVAIWRHQAGV
jgi:hypothetical protein